MLQHLPHTRTHYASRHRPVSQLGGVSFSSTTPRELNATAAVDGNQRVCGQSNLPAPFPISFDLLLAAIFAGGFLGTATVAAGQSLRSLVAVSWGNEKQKWM